MEATLQMEPLDRADHVRADPEALASLMGVRARLLLLDGLVARTGDDGMLQWGSLADAPADAEMVFLGISGERGCFAAVPKQRPPAMTRDGINVLSVLNEADLATYACARSLVDWHARHQFCAVCGGHTALAKGGWQRDCTNPECGANHFPRTDPVTIMTVEHRSNGQRRLLLGRGRGWPEGFYSTLAGFVEPGETIEQAVAREVLEEAGMRVRDVSYLVSQAWPFPSQLMIGCVAHSDSEDITIDKTELSDARWFTEDDVAKALAGTDDAPYSPPPPYALGNTLMRRWLEQGLG